MDVKINGVMFHIFEYDDENTILERWALEIDDTALPSFFRVKSKTSKSITIEDVRDIINQIPEKNLSNEDIISKILADFPYLRKRDIGVLWILSHHEFKKGKAEPEVDVDGPIKFLNVRGAFTTVIRTNMTVEDFQKETKNQRDAIRKKIERQLVLFAKLDEIEPVETSNFTLDESSINLSLKLPGKENILDIFDAINATAEIPFIYVVYQQKKIIKVYQNFFPPDIWLEETEDAPINNEMIKFKFLDAEPSLLSSKRVKIENLYSDGIWTPENTVVIDFKSKENFEKNASSVLIDKLLDMRINYEILSSKQLGIKGTFKTDKLKFDKVIFADLINTNDIFRSLTFLDERQKTIIQRERYYFYYSFAHDNDPSQALGVSIIASENDKNLTIRITHCLNEEQASVTKNVLAKLFAINNQEYEGIADIYSKYIPSFVGVPKVKKTKKTKKNLKTGDRLADLKATEDPIFKGQYSGICQRYQQPYIVNDDEYEENLQRLGNNPHKFLRFENRWYACDPNPNRELLIWPGIVQNKIKKSGKWADYVQKYPWLPCCLKKDQYTRSKSKLKMYLETLGQETKKVAPKPKDTGYIVEIGKILSEKNKGRLPFNWERIFKFMGMNRVKIGAREKTAKEFYPILRQGVMESPDSFFHCMETAMNTKYSKLLNDEEKKKHVMEVRKKISEMGLAIGRQSLYQFTDEEIRNMLFHPEAYIAAEDFVELAQKYYQCNIFLYKYDINTPDGDVVVPNYSKAYLYRQIDDTLPCVLILKYETTDYPYQCELICQVEVERSKIQKTSFRFEGTSEIAQMAIRLLYDSNEVFYVSVAEGRKGYVPYQPVLEI